MTPGRESLLARVRTHGTCRARECRAAPRGAETRRTERMPQDQGELGHLLPLLAQLQQGGLARVLVEQVGDVLQRAAVVLGHRGLERVVLGVGLGQGAETVVGAGEAVVVLLLSDTGGGGGGLGVVLVRRLLVHPGRLGLGILVVAVEVRIRHHFGDRPLGADERGELSGAAQLGGEGETQAGRSRRGIGYLSPGSRR